jgi:MFS family permease
MFTASLHGIIINLNEFWGLAVSCLLYGVLFAIISSQLPAIVFEASGPDRYPYTMARINMMCGLGDVFGPLLGGMNDYKDFFLLLFHLANQALITTLFFF